MSEVKFNIREAISSDASELLLMAVAYLRETEKIEPNNAELKALSEELLSNLLNGPIILLVAEKHKRSKMQIIGYSAFDIRATITGSRIAWGHHLYVKPEFRASDIADALLLKSEQIAIKVGATEVYIDTAIPDFFKRKHGYKDKYVVVSKILEGINNVE